MSLRAQIALLVAVSVLAVYGTIFGVYLASDRAHTLEKSDTSLRLLSLYTAGQLAGRFQSVSILADQLL